MSDNQNTNPRRHSSQNEDTEETKIFPSVSNSLNQPVTQQDYDALVQYQRNLEAEYEHLLNENDGLRKDIEVFEESGAHNYVDESNRLNAYKTRIDLERQELDDQKDQLEQERKQDKTVRNALVAGCAILGILGIVFASLYFIQRRDNEASAQMSTTQQEQNSNLKSSYDQEKSARYDAENKNKDLQNRLDSSNKTIRDLRDSQKDTESQLKDKDNQIKALTDQLNQSLNMTPETVTATETAPAVTVTETPSSVSGATTTVAPAEN